MVHTQDSFRVFYFTSSLLCKEIISIDLPIISMDLSSRGKLQLCLFVGFGFFGFFFDFFFFCSSSFVLYY